MALIQKQFEGFHEAIKLRRYKENATLVEKRERIIKALAEGFDRLRAAGKKVPTYRVFNQGSYDIGVGVKPLDGDFDIDVGLAFDLNKADEPDPVVVKNWVLTALANHTKRVEMRNNCVTVFYQLDGEAAYHVDLAVYADKGKNGGKMYLARGKSSSTPDKRVWAPSDPEGLTDLINNKLSGDEAAQFRRVIRYLKRWKDYVFSADGNAAPRGIAIACAAHAWFQPSSRTIDGKQQADDLEALRNLVGAMLRRFTPRLIVSCPAEPFDDLCARMSDIQMGAFKAKLESLLTALRDAAEDPDPHTACKTLRSQLGADFPVPEREATATPQRRAITSSGHSA